MKLYNCELEEEKELKETDLENLSNDELVDLARQIKINFDDCVLRDEIIVIDALTQVAEELGRRMK